MKKIPKWVGNLRDNEFYMPGLAVIATKTKSGVKLDIINPKLYTPKGPVAAPTFGLPVKKTRKK